MTMLIYQSTDASAPTLQGIVGGTYSSGWADGSLVELLRKCLVVGYGSKAAAGWTLSYTATSRGAFRQGGGCQFYLDVLDDGSLTAGAREAQFSGFEVMTASATGTGEFPTSTQQATRLKHRKSDTADTVQRPWLLMADNKTFMLFTWTVPTSTQYAASYFGDFFSIKPGDAYNCIAIGRTASAAVDNLENNLPSVGGQAAVLGARTGHYIPRGYSQVGTALNVGKVGAFFQSQGGTALVMGGATGLAFPNPTDLGFWLSRCYIIDPTTVPLASVRGYLRGLWAAQHTYNTVAVETNFAGVGTLAGRTFKGLGLVGGSFLFTVETSDTWD